MRTLKLTHEQIALIQQALGIAEQKFTDIQKDIIEKTCNVRGNKHYESEEINVAKFYHSKACNFADLNVAISNSDLDIIYNKYDYTY